MRGFFLVREAAPCRAAASRLWETSSLKTWEAGWNNADVVMLGYDVGTKLVGGYLSRKNSLGRRLEFCMR